MNEIQLLVAQIERLHDDMREGLVLLEQRLGARIDTIRPQCDAHAARLAALETSVTAMDSQRKTILGLVAFAGTIVGTIVAYVMRLVVGR